MKTVFNSFNGFQKLARFRRVSNIYKVVNERESKVPPPLKYILLNVASIRASLLAEEIHEEALKLGHQGYTGVLPASKEN